MKEDSALSQIALSQEWFCEDADAVAQKMLGAYIVSYTRTMKPVGGRIVETEAYSEDDPASHSYQGRRTGRTKVMFEEAGRTYVYFTYGMHYCVNIVTGEMGKGAAVLIRAIEPLFGIDVMRKRRNHNRKTLCKDIDLCRGPGRLTQALGIQRHTHNANLVYGKIEPLSLRVFIDDEHGTTSLPIEKSMRIGINKKTGDKLLRRYFVQGSEFVSGTT